MKYLIFLKYIYFGALVIIITCFGCYDVGNIGKLTFIKSNLSQSCIDNYGYEVMLKYNLPDSLSDFSWNYDHVKVTNLFFEESPRAVYRVVLYPSCRILSVYDLEKRREITRETQISEHEIRLIASRFEDRILKQIWLKAKNNNMNKSTMYIFPDQTYFLYE